MSFRHGNMMQIIINITIKEYASILRHGFIVASCHIKHSIYASMVNAWACHVNVYVCGSMMSWYTCYMTC